MSQQTRYNNGAGNEVTSYSYTLLGNVEKVSGTGANPVKYVYDGYGRKTTQIQYRDAIDGSKSSTVEWAYAPGSGVLRSKTHFDGATRNTEYYSYNELGNLKKRTTARGIVYTDYLYSVKGVDLDGAGSAPPIAAGVGTGELLSQNHSDATPDVAYTYDKMGRIKTVADYTGTRTFDYTSLNGLALYKENLPDGFYGASKDFVYGYETDGTDKVRGRYASVSYNGATWSQTYSGSDGRLSYATASGSGFSTPFLHSYDDDSRHLTVVNSNGYKQERVYESWRENMQHSKTHWSSGPLRAHFTALTYSTQSQVTSSRLDPDNDATYENLNDKLRLASGGSGTISYSMTYDKLGQLKTWDTSRTTGTEASYSWDAAGNPTDFDGAGYDVDGFNQIEPTVSGTQYGYDADGDLTSDGAWTYRYDANNRLYRMSGSGKSLQFKYDYMGRRVEKKVWNVVKNVNDDSLWTSAANTHLKFAYQGMELVAELNSSGGLLKSFHWGLDKSDTRGGAGGAMGLLMWRDYTTSQSYYPSYDLNGNVAGLLDSSGQFVAWYEYDGFGNLETSGGTMKDANPIRFSTQYTDKETGLVYYGFRYYSPSLGRFLNRDPIGESGGLNLYRFVGNDPINRVDVWGLEGDMFELAPVTSTSGGTVGINSGLDYSRQQLMNAMSAAWSNALFSLPRDYRGDFSFSNFVVATPTPQDEKEDQDEAPKENDWKPNKEDCGALASRYSDVYNSKPGESTFNSESRAALALGFHIALEASNIGWSGEFGGSVYRSWNTDIDYGLDAGGRYGIVGVQRTFAGYSFTKPSPGGSDSWNLFIDGANTWFRDNIGYVHNHTTNPGMASEDFSVGRFASDSAFSERLSTHLYLVTPSFDFRVLVPNDEKKYAFENPFDFSGHRVNEISKGDFSRLVQCKEAGF